MKTGKGCAKFSFGTKAETLSRIGRFPNGCIVPEFMYFSVSDWKHGKANICAEIARRFHSGHLAIRSSAFCEDSSRSSMAGAFKSCLNISASTPKAIASAVDKVIKSYPDNPRNQVLVQRMVSNAVFSGVAMTCDLNTGAPYYVINYDDETNKTDMITSGGTVNKTVYIFADVELRHVKSPRIRKVLESIRKIAARCQFPWLDIEFALDANIDFHLLQVRKITVSDTWDPDTPRAVRNALPHMENFIAERMKPRENVYGRKTILGIMPDWNPAELVGVAPRTLAASIFRELVSRDVWRRARELMGYRILPAEELMVSLGCCPYIDVRNSFNSFLPARLSPKTGRKLVEKWLGMLMDSPHLHDKIEYEIVKTCLDFNFDEDAKCLSLPSSELAEFKESLRALTIKAIDLSKDGTLHFALREIARLRDRQRRRLLKCDTEQSSLSLGKVAFLLDECKQMGTLPFSIIARHAFIADAILRSALKSGALTQRRYDEFKASLNTIGTQFTKDVAALGEGRKDMAEFMEEYGHLRPGTFDIESVRYIDRQEDFKYSSQPEGRQAPPPFSLTAKERRALDGLLLASGMESISSAAFIDYCRKSIAGREYAKFVFSRDVSDILEMLASWGKGMNLTRAHMANISILDIISADVNSLPDDMAYHFLSLAKEGKRLNKLSHAIKLGPLITSSSSLYIVPSQRCVPNFVGGVCVKAKTFKLGRNIAGDVNLFGKIVCIENADPGFDWIFGHDIKGLITKYGGANSHMTIRCAELKIPAAIGCGEQLFERAANAISVELNCKDKIVRPIYEDIQ